MVTTKYNYKVIWYDGGWLKSDPSYGLNWKWFKVGKAAGAFAYTRRREGCTNIEVYEKKREGLWHRLHPINIQFLIK